MTAADLQKQRPQHRLSHLEERPAPPSRTSWVGDPAQLRSHVALAKKSPHPFAEGRITHGLTPSPAEPAGRGTCTPYSTGSVHHFQPTCEFAAPPPSALLPAPPAGSSPSRTSLLLGRSALCFVGYPNFAPATRYHTPPTLSMLSPFWLSPSRPSTERKIGAIMLAHQTNIAQF